MAQVIPVMCASDVRTARQTAQSRAVASGFDAQVTVMACHLLGTWEKERNDVAGVVMKDATCE